VARHPKPVRAKGGGAGGILFHVHHRLLEFKKPRFYGAFLCLDSPALSIEKLAADRARIGEVRKAGQLLADAAKSLDLPERATPAQIVGALAERPLITPEAFTLLREARIAENAG